jgi:PAS domain-containing protein
MKLSDDGIGRYQTNTKVSMDMALRVVHPKVMADCQGNTASQNELRTLVDALPGLVWTALPDGRIEFLNQRWREYTGLSVEEAMVGDGGPRSTPETYLSSSNAGERFSRQASQVKSKRGFGVSMENIAGS